MPTFKNVQRKLKSYGYEFTGNDVENIANIVDPHAWDPKNEHWGRYDMVNRRIKSRGIALAALTAAQIVVAGCSQKNCTELAVPGAYIQLGDCPAPSEGSTNASQPIDDTDIPTPGS